MKELFGKHGSVVYVDYQRGDVSAHVRMETKEETTDKQEDTKDTHVKERMTKSVGIVNEQSIEPTNVGHHRRDELTKSTPRNNGMKAISGTTPPTMKDTMATVDSGTTIPTIGVGNNQP